MPVSSGHTFYDQPQWLVNPIYGICSRVYDFTKVCYCIRYVIACINIQYAFYNYSLINHEKK